MTLRERFSATPPLGYSGYWFKHRGETKKGIHSLIDVVLDRYARMHGFVESDRAAVMQLRLADQYSYNPLPVIGAFNERIRMGCNVYPLQEAEKLRGQYIKGILERTGIPSAYLASRGEQ